MGMERRKLHNGEEQGDQNMKDEIGQWTDFALYQVIVIYVERSGRGLFKGKFIPRTEGKDATKAGLRAETCKLHSGTGWLVVEPHSVRCRCW